MTDDDNDDHGDQDEDEQDDSTRHPLQSHPGLENRNSPSEFHKKEAGKRYRQ